MAMPEIKCCNLTIQFFLFKKTEGFIIRSSDFMSLLTLSVLSKIM